LINTIGAARKRAYDAITLDEAPLPSLVSSNDITISRDLTNGYVAPNKRARTINGTGTGGAVPSSSSGTGITIPAGAVLVMPSNDRPVRDLNDPLFWSLAFPTLFWRGIGVPGQPRQHVISLREWAKHVMKSCYHHYRLHRSFPFVLMVVVIMSIICMVHHHIHYIKQHAYSCICTYGDVCTCMLPYIYI
jgi:hypothetical protein